MNIKNKTTKILAIIILLSSCSTENSKKDFETITFKTEQASLKDSLDFKFIPLVTNDNCLIGQMTFIQLVDNRLFIEDKYYSNSFFVFDLKGRFITKIGEHGAGPNQYSRIFDFDIDRKGRKIDISDMDA